VRLDERTQLSADLAVHCDPQLELHLCSPRALATARPASFAGYIITHGKRLV
jgi:hypothetical protein